MPFPPALADNDVHAWCAPLEQETSRVDDFLRTLSVDEKERAGRFAFARDRKRFIVGRGVLRELLGRYLKLEPQQLVFSYGSKGKPSLAQERCRTSAHGLDLRFNLSHSGGLALYAFTRGREIGVDIEQLRALEDAEQIARQNFSPGEVQVLRSLPSHQKLEGFFNCWSRKEAYIKATGDGLSMPLDCFEVSLIPGERARFLRVQGDDAGAARWSLRALHAAPGYIAAVCLEGEWKGLQCWSWLQQMDPSTASRT